MNKNKQFCGIDISKDVFDVIDNEDNHHQYSNDHSGFQEFYKILSDQSHCVMEVTGSYYQGLATWPWSPQVRNKIAFNRIVLERSCFVDTSYSLFTYNIL